MRLSNERQVTPKMKWERINDESENEKGEILCTTELFEVRLLQVEKLNLFN